METAPFADSSHGFPSAILPDEEPIDVMIWNVQQDGNFAAEMMTHLTCMRRTDGISVKNFLLDIRAGTTSAQSIARLVRARIRLVLISSYFIHALVNEQLTIDASDAVVTESSKINSAERYRMIPTLVRPVSKKAYEQDPLFGKLQCLPRDGRPIQAWRNHDEAWADVVNELRRVLLELGRVKPPKRSW